jgi:hypothetical protein
MLSGTKEYCKDEERRFTGSLERIGWAEVGGEDCIDR